MAMAAYSALTLTHAPNVTTPITILSHKNAYPNAPGLITPLRRSRSALRFVHLEVIPMIRYINVYPVKARVKLVTPLVSVLPVDKGSSTQGFLSTAKHYVLRGTTQICIAGYAKNVPVHVLSVWTI
jgi:hypothetical protein